MMPWPCAMVLTFTATKDASHHKRCHGLAPWRFTLALTSPSFKRERPRREAVASIRRSIEPFGDFISHPRHVRFQCLIGFRLNPEFGELIKRQPLFEKVPGLLLTAAERSIFFRRFDSFPTHSKRCVQPNCQPTMPADQIPVGLS